jgi:hypothetical protein
MNSNLVALRTGARRGFSSIARRSQRTIPTETDLVEKLRAPKVEFEELIFRTKFTTCFAEAI